MPIPISDSGLDLSSFTGWVPFAQLPESEVPTGAGVYVIVRRSSDPPAFLAVSPAGHLKGKDPTVSVTELEKLWVPGARIIYIGKANLGTSGKRGLRKRLNEFHKHGAGSNTAHHSGGRRIWQLADHADLLVGWRQTSDAEAAATESQLIIQFRDHHGRLPFANMRNGSATRRRRQ
ncbi:hypothetical protein [Mycobacteroides chelonae]|uniref:hypothetical protein n=1 Tax=Mycobacteroides chelonae TaxID=1774 RepID=UPI0038774B29